MPTLRDVEDRFRSLVEKTKRLVPLRSRSESTDGAPSSPSVVLAAVLSEWATDAPPEFAAWLDDEIARANAHAHEGVGTAPGAWWLGTEFGLKYIREAMTKWRQGQPASNPLIRPPAP